MPGTYTIARLAAAAGVHVETVRYYQRRGLMPELARPPGGIRRYRQADADRLRFIRRAQTMASRWPRSGACSSSRPAVPAVLRGRSPQRSSKTWVRACASCAGCDANRHDASCPVIDRLARPERELRHMT